MKTKQQMIEAIYEKIADKSISKGCIIEYKNSTLEIGQGYYMDDFKTFGILKACTDKYFYYALYDGGELYNVNLNNKYIKVIGHPVMIGDCDKIFNRGPCYFDDWIKVLDLWRNKTKPIEEQSIECIKYIYNLIK